MTLAARPTPRAQLEDTLIRVYSDLMDQELDEKEIALGFLDETSPQLTANTVRVSAFWQR